MHFFQDHQRRSDPQWEVASATQIVVADPDTVTRLAAEIVVEQDAAVEAVLVAVRHPTGWFVHAVRRDDLAGASVASLRELVTVRTYLLLSRGPQAPVWYPAVGKHTWHSISYSLGRDLDALDDVLVD
jgi:hypothetical protein